MTSRLEPPNSKLENPPYQSLLLRLMTRESCFSLVLWVMLFLRLYLPECLTYCHLSLEGTAGLIPARGNLHLKQIRFALGTAGFLLSCFPSLFAFGTIRPYRLQFPLSNLFSVFQQKACIA
jgi:hypothetical protein